MVFPLLKINKVTKHFYLALKNNNYDLLFTYVATARRALTICLETIPRTRKPPNCNDCHVLLQKYSTILSILLMLTTEQLSLSQLSTYKMVQGLLIHSLDYRTFSRSLFAFFFAFQGALKWLSAQYTFHGKTSFCRWW